MHDGSVLVTSTSFLSGTGAAGGIALINTIANAGGVLSPYLMGWLKSITGHFTAGQLMLGLTMLIGSTAGSLHTA